MMPNHVTLLAVGDILIKDNLLDLIYKNGKSYIFSELKPYIQAADIAFANLETPLVREAEKNSKKDPTLPFLKTDPIVAEAIKDAGFNIVCLANNHIMDYGANGLEETLNVLVKNKINFVGAGMSLKEAKTPVFMESRGIKFGFLAYANTSPATKNSAGCAPLVLKDMLDDIRQVKQKSDFVIVSLHQGIEYSDYPVPEHRSITEQLIDGGADLVLGHHPHVLQGMESYKKGSIVHSMGNLIFDQSKEEDDKRLFTSYLATKAGFEFQKGDRRLREGILFGFDFNKGQKIEIKLNPFCQDNLDIPRMTNKSNGVKALARYKKISDDLSNPGLSIWKTLEMLYSCENVETLNQIELKTLVKKIFRVRARHIGYLKNYFLSICKKYAYKV